MRTEATLHIDAYCEGDIRKLFNSVIEFGRAFKTVKIEKFVCDTHDEFDFNVELHGINEDD